MSETKGSLPPNMCLWRNREPDISHQTTSCAKLQVKTIQCYGTWKYLSPGRRTLVYLRVFKKIILVCDWCGNKTDDFFTSNLNKVFKIILAHDWS